MEGHVTIVERLRDRADSYRQSGPSAEHTAVLLEEAAIEIERLQRERNYAVRWANKSVDAVKEHDEVLKVIDASRDDARRIVETVQSDFDARIRSALVERKAEPVAHIVERRDGSRRAVMLVEKYDPRDPDFWLDEEARRNHIVTPLFSASPTPPAAAVTEGWQLVPKEPTEEMLDAYWHQTGESKEMRARTHAYMRRYYSAMLYASPSPVGEGRDGLIEALRAKAREVGPLFIEDIDEVVAALSLPEHAEDRKDNE